MNWAHTLKEVLHNSLRTVLARLRAIHFVAFLANSTAIGKKRRLVAHPYPHYHRLARVMQDIPSRQCLPQKPALVRVFAINSVAIEA